MHEPLGLLAAEAIDPEAVPPGPQNSSAKEVPIGCLINQHRCEKLHRHFGIIHVEATSQIDRTDL